MRLLLKRDDTSNNHPAPDQLEVGELVMNSVTGRMYTKLTNGTIMEYIGQKVCFEASPIITFYYENIEILDTIDKFCCAGALLTVKVDALKPDPSRYTFQLIELTSNTSQQNINIQTPEYSTYEEEVDQETVTYRRALIPITVSVNPTSYTNISIFKFAVLLEGSKVAEKLITIKCLEATT